MVAMAAKICGFFCCNWINPIAGIRIGLKPPLVVAGALAQFSFLPSVLTDGAMVAMAAKTSLQPYVLNHII
jgi:hypothetical protein